MNCVAPELFENSEIHFFSPSLRAKRLCYTPTCVGHFYCNNNYHLKRENYDSILIAYVIKGSFTFQNYKGDFETASENEMVILDCYEPHEYFTKSRLEFKWIHIDGINCREFCREIVDTKGHIIKLGKYSHTKDLIYKIFDGVKNNTVTEQELSLTIYQLFMELLSTTKIGDNSPHKENIIKAKEFIADNLSNNITVEDLAKIANMSVTNFSRVFRQHTGFSPYDYVLSSRINKAKEYLLKTDISIAQCAYETGFNSEANFIFCFTNSEGISPGKFRKLKF